VIKIFKKIRKAVSEALKKPWGMVRTSTYQQYSVNFEAFKKEAYNNPFFAAPINEIVRTFNAAEIGVYRKVKTSEGGTKLEKVENHKVNKWLKKPNSGLTQSTFQKYYLVWKYIQGGCLLYKSLGVETRQLYIYSPDSFKIKRDTNNFMITGIKIGENTITDPDELAQYHLVREFNINDKIAGLDEKFAPVISPLAKVGDMSNFGFTHQNSQLANSGKRVGIVEYKKNLGEAKAEELNRKFNELGKGADNAGNVATVHGEDFKFTPMDVTPQEMDWLSSMKFVRELIASTIGVPVQLISTEGTTYNNVKEFKKKLYSDITEPELKAYSQDMTAFLVDDLSDDEFIWYDLSGVEELKTNAADIVEQLNKALEGKVTINEFRNIVNTLLGESIQVKLEPIPDKLADQVLVSTSLMPLSDLGISLGTDGPTDED